MGLLLVGLLGALLALLSTRTAWFDLEGGGAQAGAAPFADGCPRRKVPEVARIAAHDLPALRDVLSPIMPPRVGRVYEAGRITTANLFSDNEPEASPPGSSTSAAYEVRWWALDRDGGEDDVGADVLEFANESEADDALALATSPDCHSPHSHAAAHTLRFPAGASELTWLNPDRAWERDVVFVRASRLYRVGDVPPGLLGVTGPEQSRLEWQRAALTARKLACALPAAGCPAAAASSPDTSLANLPSNPTAGATAAPPPSAAQAIAYAHAVNMRSYDVPGMTQLAREGPTRDRAYWEGFVRCAGELPPTRTVATIHSPEFAERTRDGYEVVYTTVAVLPSRALAARYAQLDSSERARSCIAASVGRVLHAYLGKTGLRDLGDVALTPQPTPVPRSYRGAGPYRATALRIAVQATYATSADRRMRLPVYVQGFAVARGPAVVELTSLTLGQPFREDRQRFLEAQMVGSAEANEASL